MIRISALRALCVLAIVAAALSLVVPCAAADDLSFERGRYKAILKNVAGDVEKNFYDPGLKSLDWKAQLEAASQRIDKAKSVTEMLVAIYVFVDKLQDSHTKFLPPARAIKLFYGFDAKAIGDDIRIFELRGGDAAEKAGLKLGDRLISINGYRCDRATFDVMMIDLRVLRPRLSIDMVVQTGNEAPRAMRLEARRKTEPALLGSSTREGDIWDSIIEAENEEQEHPYYTATREGGIGYVWIRKFPSEGEDFLKGLIEKVRSAKAIVIDLRSNPGGSLDCLKSFTGIFEQKETAAFTIISRKKTEPWVVKPQRLNMNVPMYILIDSRTGSAAELFARHFQRTGRAVVIGDHSPGRVTVSRFFSGTNGAQNAIPYGVQIGTARAVFPDGEELEKRGVTPDVVCIPTGDDMMNDRDVCQDKAVSMARDKIGYKVKEKEKVAVGSSGD